MNLDTRRDQILELVRREFVGPDPIDKEGLIQKNGEEILSSDPPRIRYSAGILFPQGSVVLEEDKPEGLNNEESTIENEINDDISEEFNNNNQSSDIPDDSEELINRSNAYHQSAISLTVAIKNNDKIRVEVKAGQYEKKMVENANGKKNEKYLRSSLHWVNNNQFLKLPDKNERSIKYDVICSNKTELKFHVIYRYVSDESECVIYTFTLENTKKAENDLIRDEDCYFQTEFHLFSEKAFAHLPEGKRININDEDYETNELLYRNIRNYAIGHGCSADWKVNDKKVIEIYTEVFPSYEIKPIVPNILSEVSLDMYNMSDYTDIKEIVKELEKMCDLYKSWIEDLKKQSKDLEEHYQKTANRHIKNCENCHKRMFEGLELLRSDPVIQKAFQYMNRSMLLQQLHYNLPLQEWEDDGNGGISIANPVEMPKIDKPDTWYGNDNRVYGKWRPFQIAFVLINLKSMTVKNCDDRKIVDLIWFPTGGGKTEAYLGLTAYTIFMRRLQGQNDEGTTILMRYTLRLLTAQQYERAASMICACELIRKEKEVELGNKRITIGLWVGGDTTPNKMSGDERSAVKMYESLYRGSSEQNPFIMLKCPWCGAKMGVVHVGKDKTPKISGYYKRRKGRALEIVFKCSNKNCDFSKEDFDLPLSVVDEAIYKNPPTLLLGTVDKFAMLPYKPEAQKLFGIVNGKRVAAPDLVIQDELHLISGPVGSMVGHYETLIIELCTDRRDNKLITPKIIASTATISRAKEQCHALYNCGKENVIQFPPSGIDAGDSFFAKEDQEKIGRKYVGIFAPAASSFAMTSIRLFATLLYSAKAISVMNEDERDPYWTNLGYFNSMRELGQTATWISADINEYLHTIYKRRLEDKELGYKENRRYIYRFEELTSRVRSDKIPEKMQSLSIKYREKSSEQRPVDVCLATNMVSVGVDVPRLGLMTVVGQPKTTSEYIQATSRVGRDIPKAPGIVLILYNPGRPRDKSHYEQFKSYHSKIYSNVEPTSVTPFSAPLRERALHAVLIGLIRLFRSENTFNDPKLFPTETEIEKVFSIIEDRVKKVDEDELENTCEHLEEIMREWEIQMPQKYQDFTAGEALPLMYPAGTKANVNWDGRGMPTPTSMRSVDASCEIRVLSNIYVKEEI